MEVMVTKDIRSFKQKDIGPFSFREAGVIAIGAVSGLAIYKIAGAKDIAIIVAVAILVLGFFRPKGMSCIEFIRTVFKESVYPKILIDATDFELSEETLEEDFGSDVKLADVIQTTDNNKTKEDKDYEKKRIMPC